MLTLGHHENLEDIEIINKKGQVVAKVPPSQIQIMDLVSYETITATVSNDQFAKISEGNIVTFIELQGKIIVIEIREGKE